MDAPDTHPLENPSIHDLLGCDGPLAHTLPNFAPREQQQQLAQAIHLALEQQSVLVSEAGTGVGKTLAYLIPALLSEHKTIISTGTRHLQDQLFHRDIPQVQSALKSCRQIALLKGRNNYLCKHRLDYVHQHPSLFDNSLIEQLAQVRRWANQTRTGDISECVQVPENAPIWSEVVSDADFCATHEGEDLAGCFIHQARRQAQQADLVVVNHYLLLSDLALKQRGYEDAFLLPSGDAFIIDEAHQLPTIAANFFGNHLSSYQTRRLVKDGLRAHILEAADMPAMRLALEALDRAQRAAGGVLSSIQQRTTWDRVKTHADQSMQQISNCYVELMQQLEIAAPRSKRLALLYKRCKEQADILAEFIAAEKHSNWIQWVEAKREHYTLRMTPLQVASLYQASIAHLDTSWVYTSATLSVDRSFSYFKHELGLDEDCQECYQTSPFDYRSQMLLYLPQDLPEPAQPNYLPRMIERARAVIRASEGRTFMLFTSYRALDEAYQLLADIEYPLLRQGDAPKHELLAQFVEQGHAILLGTTSFWEGVDIRGDALSCVIIDKLPFAAPTDPVIQARIEAMRTQGQDPFKDFQIPQAIIALKQGVGRLIRDRDDRGVVMIGDTRLQKKHYGKLFLRSLQDASITSDYAQVADFFAQPHENLATD